MKKESILHMPLSQYAFASSENELTIRLRAAKNDLKECILYYGDRACKHSPVDFYPIPMKVVWEDSEFQYFEIQFKTNFTRVCYYFLLKDENEWFYYYADEFKKNLPDLLLDNKIVEGRSEYYQYPFILRDEIVNSPEWFKNAIVYNIFPDSFANKKRAIDINPQKIILSDNNTSMSLSGGTINGIIENLDYISNMGFNCIYLNPIFVAGEWHKYDILDYFHIDPCFGSDDDFKKLVDSIHEKNMYIIIDGVFNHCSWNFFAFDDVVKNGEKSKYVNWFYKLNFPVQRPESEDEIPNYSCFAYERKMPKLNTSNEEVQNYFANVCKYWIEEYKIDGWRLDVANEVDKNFWRKFRKTAKASNPQCVLIGEVWENSSVWLKGDMFDSTMNYDFRKLCRDYIAFNQFNNREFAFGINKMLLRYPTNTVEGQLNLINSHDVPRFLSMCSNDISKYKIALLLLFSLPGVPSMFYGDELEVNGITENAYRKPMPWEDCDNKLGTYVSNLISIRKKYIPYYSTIQFEDNGVEELLVYSRLYGEEKITFIINNSNKNIRVSENKHCKVIFSEKVSENVISPLGFLIVLKS